MADTTLDPVRLRPTIPVRDLPGRANFITDRIWRLRVGVAYVSAFVLAYVLLVAPNFAHTGLVDRLARDGSLLLACAIAVAPAPWLASAARRPSDAGMWVLYLSAYVPSVIVPAFVLGGGWSLLPMWATIAASFCLVMAVLARVELRLPAPALSPTAYGILLLVLGAGGVAGIVWTFGVPSGIPSLDDVAGVRNEYREQLSEAGRFAGYLVWWTGAVVAPLLVAYGAWRRRPVLVIAGMAVLGIVYAATAFRSMLFLALLMVGMIALLARFRHRFGEALGTLTVLMIAACAVVAALGWMVPASMLVRRSLIVPGQVFAYYVDFFTANPIYLLSHSVLEGIVIRPFPQTPPALIGERYFNDPLVSANGNLWADGVANFGMAGIVLASLVLAIVLVGLDAVARGKPAIVAISVGAAAVWGLTNSGLLTTILTHGMGLTLVLIWLLPREPGGGGTASAHRVAHVTSVHRADDPRIFLKECRTLADAGHHVTLIARGAAPTDLGAIAFHSLGDVSGRAARVVVMPWRVLRAARHIRAHLYHLHDPELLPVGMVLKLFGARVIYDAHEDLPRQIAYKPYLPSWSRGGVALAAGVIEAIATRTFDAVVAATPRIAARFPAERTVLVQNFPLMREFGAARAVTYDERPPLVAYVGRVTAEVGALVMADAARLVGRERPVRFVIAGPIETELSTAVARRAAPATVEMPGWLGREEVVDLLGAARVGLVLFQPVQNYVDAYPTKLFEYMASEVPAVASDFPVWRDIVAPVDAGLLVDPTDPVAVARAIETLLGDPGRAAEMGRRGRAAVLERYRWDEQGARLVDLYRRVLATDPASGRRVTHA